MATMQDDTRSMVPQAPEVRVIGIPGLPEIHPGDQLAPLIVDAAQRCGVGIADGDVVVITQKVVSKAEGNVVVLSEVQPSEFALRLAQDHNRDARQIEVILQQSKRIVRMADGRTGRGLIIAETHHGFVCANAAVDASNTGDLDVVTVLPEDSDASAQRVRAGIREATGAEVAVIISDTFGRPWREGITNVAIGLAGLEPIVDYFGQVDPAGYTLQGTTIAIADELASAAELVTGKLDRIPVAIVRGYAYMRGQGSVKTLLREPQWDLFR